MQHLTRKCGLPVGRGIWRVSHERAYKTSQSCLEEAEDHSWARAVIMSFLKVHGSEIVRDGKPIVLKGKL